MAAREGAASPTPPPRAPGSKGATSSDVLGVLEKVADSVAEAINATTIQVEALTGDAVKRGRLSIFSAITGTDKKTAKLDEILEIDDEKPDVAKARKRARAQAGIKDAAGKPLPLHGPLSDLGIGGVGVELLFRSLRWSIVAFALLAAAASFSLADNVQANREVYARTSLLTAAIGPCCSRSASRVVSWQALPFLATMLILLGFLLFIRFKQRTVAQRNDGLHATAADYAVQVRRIPAHVSSADELHTFFSQFGAVEHIAVGHKSAAYVALLDEWKALEIEWRERREKLRVAGAQRGAENSGAKLETVRRLQVRLLELEEGMHRVKTHGAGAEATGTAFVAFTTERAKYDCLVEHNPSLITRALELLRPKAKRYHGVRLQIVVAPEPSDVWWENLEITRCSVALRAAFTFACTAALIVSSAVALTFLNRYKQEQVELLGDATLTEDGVLARASLGTGLSIAAAAVVTCVNELIKIAITRLTLFERRPTRTDYEESLYFKLALAYTINTVFLVLFIQPDPLRWSEEGGVFSQALFIALGTAAPELSKLLPVANLGARLLCTWSANTQAKLNKLWEPPAATMGEYYAAFTKTIAVGLVFGPGMPIVWFISLGTLLLAYWANKAALLRLNKPPPAMDAGLSNEFANMLSLLVLACASMMCVLLDSTLDGVQNRQDSLTPWAATMVALWALYQLAPFSCLPCFRAYENADVGSSALSFSDAEAQYKAQMQRYQNPVKQPVPSIQPVLDEERARIDAPKAQALPARPSASGTRPWLGGLFGSRGGGAAQSGGTRACAAPAAAAPATEPAAAAMVAVRVPEGCGPGARVTARRADGSSVQVVVPHGKHEGATFYMAL